jgi:hypothetical protein
MARQKLRCVPYPQNGDLRENFSVMSCVAWTIMDINGLADGGVEVEGRSLLNDSKKLTCQRIYCFMYVIKQRCWNNQIEQRVGMIVCACRLCHLFSCCLFSCVQRWRNKFSLKTFRAIPQ